MPIAFQLPRGTRVVFDRSAFHGEGFDLLRSSRLLELASCGYLRVYHPWALLEETVKLETTGKPGHPELMRVQSAFLLSICEGLLRRIPEAIYAELRGHVSSCLHMTVGEDHFVCDAFRRIVAGEGQPADRDYALGELRKHENRKLGFGEVRDRIYAESLRKVTAIDAPPVEHLRSPRVFEWFWSNRGVEIGADFVRTKLPLYSRCGADEADELAERWAAGTHAYPITTTHARAIAYLFYTARVGPRRNHDKNDMEDLNYVTSALAAEVLVTADRRFMTSCFGAVHGETGPRLVYPEQFIAGIESVP